MSRTRTGTSSAFTFAMGVMERWPTAVPAATRLSYLQTTTERWMCWSMATRVKSVLRLSKRKCERCRTEVARGNKVVQPEPNDTIRRRRTGRPRELKNDVYTNTNCENDSSIRPTICRVLARPRMLPAFHLLPLTQLALPQNMTPARSGIGLSCTDAATPLTNLSIKIHFLGSLHFSRTQEVHPLWVREIS